MTEEIDTTPPLEQEPDVAADLLGERISVLREFASQLAEHGEERGLIGPLELARLWTRHLLNSAIVAPLIRPGMVGDIGTGGGLPGLVLAIARPDAHFSLVEPMERRCVWLREQVAHLELENVEVIRARAQECGLDESLDQVTARAVSALRTLIPLTAPLLKPGGELLLMKGARVDDEMSAAQKVLRKHGVRDPEVLVLGSGILAEETRVFRATVD